MRFPIRLVRVFSLLMLMSCSMLSWASSLDVTTQNLVNLNAQIGAGKSIDTHLNNNQLKEFQLRRDEMIRGFRENPSEYVKYLLPKNQTSLLPRQIQSYVEKEVVNIEGSLEIIAALSQKLDKERLLYLIHTDKGMDYFVEFYDKVDKPLQTGQRIRIPHAFLLVSSQGVKYLYTAKQNIIITRAVAKMAIPSSLGPQKTLVMAFNFQDQPNNKPFTIEELKNTVFNVVNNVFYESSYKQTTVEGTAIGWYTTGINSNEYCDTYIYKLLSYAYDAANKSGVDLDSFTRRVYFVPRSTNCSWGGLGTIGGNPTNAWVFGYNDSPLFAHELGHNLGLPHSNLWRCDGGTCRNVEYGDNADVMGGWVNAHFNALQKDRLGWLNYQSSPPVQTITQSGTYNIYPYELANNNVKALRIAKNPNASGEYYYLEFRQPIGYDSELVCPECDFTKGILIHQGAVDQVLPSHLLQMQAGAGDKTVAFLPGSTFKDPNAPNGGVAITVNSVTPTAANVTAIFGGQPPACIRSAPTLTINPSTTVWVKAGQGYSYNMIIKNNDNQYCAPSTFNFTAQTPTGLSAVINPPSIKLTPGQQATNMVTVSTATTTAAGIYSVPVTARSVEAPTNTASVKANIGIKASCIQQAPTVTITPNSQTGKRGQMLTYGFLVANNDSAVCAQSVFVLTSSLPSGFKGLFNGTTTLTVPAAQSRGVLFSLTSSQTAIPKSYGFTLIATKQMAPSVYAAARGLYIVKI